MASATGALRGAEAVGIPPRPSAACQATTVPSEEGERDPDYRFTLANERN